MVRISIQSGGISILEVERIQKWIEKKQSLQMKPCNDDDVMMIKTKKSKVVKSSYKDGEKQTDVTYL